VLLALNEITTYYGPIRILEGMNLEVDAGELVCLLGGNAAVLQDGSTFDADLERVHTLFPRLKERERQLAGTLSGGEQQMVAMGRALMAKPRLLLMDEPSMGLSPALVQQNFRIIKEVHESGVAILMVEQNATMALSIADRGYVLSTGEIVLTGLASELLGHEELKRAYLGGA
jgi:branched-chain amino acid transport system ATP-binding protein